MCDSLLQEVSQRSPQRASGSPESDLSVARHRLGADRVERGGRADRLRIDLEVKDRGLAGLLRGLEGGREVFGSLDCRAEAAKRACVSGEVRIAQERTDDAAGKFALLMRADRAVHQIGRASCRERV